MRRQRPPGNESGCKRAAGAPDAARSSLSVRDAGRKGGLRVRELIRRGRQLEARKNEPRPH
jgi:hypothetical protein